MGRTVRFTVMTGFIERQLFKVTEVSDGSIVLVLPNGLWNAGGERVESEHVHITAHSAADHNGVWGNRIKRSVIAKTGDRYTSHLIVTDKRKRGLIWPMTSALNGIASGREFKRRGKEEVVQLIGYLGPEETIIYTLYVIDKHIDLPQVQGFSHYRTDFKNFSTVIYITFYHRENKYRQIHYSQGTDVTLKNDVSIFPTPNEPRLSFAPRMTEHGIKYYLVAISERLTDAFKDMVPLTQDRLPRLSPHPLGFNRWAALSDDIHNDFGVMAKTKNLLYDDPRGPTGRLKLPHERYQVGVVAMFPIDATTLDFVPQFEREKVHPKIAAQIEKIVSGDAADEI